MKIAIIKTENIITIQDKTVNVKKMGIDKRKANRVNATKLEYVRDQLDDNDLWIACEEHFLKR
jgi:hypothetical protein